MRGLRELVIRRWTMLRSRSDFVFRGLRIQVPHGVLNPTQMRSSLYFAESCCEVAESTRQGSSKITALELGCGSGIASLLVSQETGAEVTALDCDPLAVVTTRRNSVRNGLQVRVMVSDWDKALRSECTFDLVLVNPPFLKAELRGDADQWLTPALVSGHQHRQLAAALRACARRTSATGVAVMLTSERSGQSEVDELIESAGLKLVSRRRRRIQGEIFVFSVLGWSR